VRNIFRFTVVACALFIAFVAAAMFVYPGGHIRHANVNGYAFFLDSLSDLGETRTVRGQSNLPSLVFFCSALTLAAFALPVFFAAYAMLFSKTSAARWVAIAGALAALVAGVSFAGIAATPANLFAAAHNLFVFLAFRALLVAILGGFLASLISHDAPRSVGLTFGIFALLLCAYIVTTSLAHIPGNPSGFGFGATAQKVIVLASILTIMTAAATLARTSRSLAGSAA